MLESRTSWPVPDDTPETARDNTMMLALIAEQWYAVQHSAIKKYDAYHLIFGDKHYNRVSNWLFPILEKYVDAISIQRAGSYRQFSEHFRDVHMKTGKPIFIGDGIPAYWAVLESSPEGMYTEDAERKMGECYSQMTKDLCSAP